MKYYLAYFDEFEGEHYIDKEYEYIDIDIAIRECQLKQPKYENGLTDHIDVMDEHENVVYHGHPRF